MSILENIRIAIESTTLMEWAAVILGLLYLICISIKWIIAWAFAIFSSAIYMYLCYVSQLYLETGLQFFYVIMGLYGWYMWSSMEPENVPIIHSDNEVELDLAPTRIPIIKWKVRNHVLTIVLSTILTLVLGYLFDIYTGQANPYADAFSSVFSLTATYLVTKKILENWIYWIIIDLVGIYLFSSRGLYLTSSLYFLYTLIAIFGFFRWRKLMRLQ